MGAGNYDGESHRLLRKGDTDGDAERERMAGYTVLLLYDGGAGGGDEWYCDPELPEDKRINAVEAKRQLLPLSY